jgi:hypothetical protein
MQKLKLEYHKNERRLVQMKRTNKIAMYAVYPEYGNTLYGYEVICILIRPIEKTPSGRVYPEREAYPGNEQWGKSAWSFGILQLDKAENCFNRLAESEEELDRSDEL